MNFPESYVRSLKPAEGDKDLRPDSSRLTADERRARLQKCAIAADGAADLEISLALLWRELVHGVCRVADNFFTEERCYVVLSPPATTTPLHGRRLAILEAVLCGTGQKNVAIDQGLAPSTVALNARLGLEQLGLTCKPSRVHPLLMLAAKAGTSGDGTPAASLSFIDVGGRQLRVVSAARPDRGLVRVLPPAELAVIRLLVEGLRYDEIARVRQTSTRTIANQITAVFRRMRVSGRNELIARLFFTEGFERVVSQPTWPGPSEPAATTSTALATSVALRSA